MIFFTNICIVIMLLVCIISDSVYSADCLATLELFQIPITKEKYETYTFFFNQWTKNNIHNYRNNPSSAILCTVEEWGNGYGLDICNSVIQNRTMGLKNAEEYCIEFFYINFENFGGDTNKARSFIINCTAEIENDGLKYKYGIDNFAFQKINFNAQSNLRERTKHYIQNLYENMPKAEKYGEISYGTGPTCCIKDLATAGFEEHIPEFNDIIDVDVNFDSFSRKRKRGNDIDQSSNGSSITYNRYYKPAGINNINLIRNLFSDCTGIVNIVVRSYCIFVRTHFYSQIKVIEDVVKNENQHAEELTIRNFLSNYSYWCLRYYNNH